MDTKELEQSLSMDEILKTIRSVVSEGMEKQEEQEDDVLELTEIIEVGSLAKSPNKEHQKSKDILDTINEVIGEAAADDKPEPLAAKSSTREESKSVKQTPDLQEQKEITALTKSDIDLELKENLSKDSITSTDKKEIESPTIKLEKDLSLESNLSPSKKEGLISEQAIEASAKALKALISEEKNFDKIEELGTKVTVEELVTRILEPKLSKWLDENLPIIVQKIVEKEIKKIIPKAKK